MTSCKPNRSRVERPWHLDTWWVSWERGFQQFAVRVRTDPDGRIVEAAPLVRKFLGQKLKRLEQWVGESVRVERLS